MTHHERFEGACFFTNIPGAYGTMGGGGGPCGWRQKGGAVHIVSEELYICIAYILTALLSLRGGG